MVRKREHKQSTLEKIRTYRRGGLGPDAIYDELVGDSDVEDFPFGTRDADVQWIKRWVKANVVEDPSGPWSFIQAGSIDDAPLALSVLSHVHKWSKGNVTYITNAEADLIIRIRKACPRMLLSDVWHFTQEYLARRRDSDPALLQELDVFIGYVARDHEPGALLEPVPPGSALSLAQKSVNLEVNND